VSAQDWTTVATLATAFGTLVLAIATFGSVRSANRAARVAEAAFQVRLRPVLVTSRLDDPAQKIRWVDDHWARLEGSRAHVDLVGDNMYLAFPVRNVGPGLGVIIGWYVWGEMALADVPHADPESFRMQTRDLYIAAGDMGFWQGALREIEDPEHDALARVVKDAQPFTIDVLYGDSEGGQRTITRFGLIPHADGETRWFPTVARHWNLDRPDPR
jgi:hypothetical protein